MISIAMATYNGERFLAEQIDSILKQTIQNFELIVCDDCSTDDTWNILMKYQDRDNRIHCFRNERNLGYAKNFERAMILCKGNYIAFSDQDDIWTEDHLQILFDTIGDNIACCSDAILLENGKLTDKLSDRIGGGVSQLDTVEKKLKRILYSATPYSGNAMMLNKMFLKNILPISTVSHDTWISLYACIMNGFIYSNKITVHYRQHFSQLSGLRKKQTVWSDIKNLTLIKNKKPSERPSYCEELIKRFPDMDDSYKKILNEAILFHRNVHNRWFRFKNILFWIKIYPYRFPGQSRYLLVPKLIRFLFL